LQYILNLVSNQDFSEVPSAVRPGQET
jgi:hypothetical protein